MIEIRLSDGNSLDLYADTALNLENNNPLFDTDIIKGSLVYPFDIPGTPSNRKKLGFPSELLNRITTAGKYQASIWLRGNLFKLGVLQLEKVVDDKITCTFVSGAGGLNSADLSKKLSQLDYGSPIPFSYNSFTAEGRTIPGGGLIGLAIDFTLNGVTTTFHKLGTIAVSNQTTYKAAIEELVSLFLADTSGMAANHVLDVKSYYNSLKTFRNKIFFKLADGVSAVFNTGNADYQGTWGGGEAYLLDPLAADMKTIAGQSYPDVSFNFPVIKAQDFYGDVADYAGYLNFYAPDIQEYIVPQTIDGFRYGRVAVPMPYFVGILKKAIESAGYKITGSFTDDADVKKLLIVNNYALDSMVYNAADPTNTHASNIYINTWSQFINLANHVPEISISDFLNAVKNFFHLGVFVDDVSRSVELEFLETVITDTESDDWTTITIRTGKEVDFNSGHGYSLKIPDDVNADITARAITLNGTVKDPVASTSDLAALTDQANGDIRLVTDLDQYYQCTRLFDGTVYTFQWNFFSENYQDYKTGDGSTEIPISIGTLLPITEQEPGRVPNWLLPNMSGSGSTQYFDIGINKMPFALLSYHGMQEDSGGNNYPFASSGYKDIAGSDVGDLALKPYNAVNAIYEKYYKSWLAFLNRTRPVVRVVQFDQATLTNLNLRRKKRIEGVQLIVSKITVQITMQGIKPATVYFYTV